MISVDQAALEAGVHRKTVVRMINAGDLPGYRVGRRGVLRVDRRDVEEILIRRIMPGSLQGSQ
jgi:excisionase family DNA binding protein